MRIVLAIGLAAALVGCFGAGCAGEPAAEPEPVVRQSELRGAQAVREVVAIRTAGANAGVLSTKIFGTIAAAGRQSRAEGGRLLRRELPPLLAAAATVWPRSYRAIAAQAPRREAARGSARSCSGPYAASRRRSPDSGESSAAPKTSGRRSCGSARGAMSCDDDSQSRSTR